MKSSHWIQSLYSVLFCFVAIDKYSVSTLGQILRKTRDCLRSLLSPAPSPPPPAFHLPVDGPLDRHPGGPPLIQADSQHLSPLLPRLSECTLSISCLHNSLPAVRLEKVFQALWKHEKPSLPGVIDMYSNGLIPQTGFFPFASSSAVRYREVGAYGYRHTTVCFGPHGIGQDAQRKIIFCKKE